ncbi:MAG: hypothetical protein M3546_17065 [Actinomycetota bacterium]|nr:hypothetical protein [Actinomycetota bacterium]
MLARLAATVTNACADVLEVLEQEADALLAGHSEKIACAIARHSSSVNLSSQNWRSPAVGLG